jgi:hypothetical protein
LFLERFHAHASLAQQVERFLVERVVVKIIRFVNKPANAGGGNHFRARIARVNRYVQRRALAARAVLRALNNRVLLGVQRANAVVHDLVLAVHDVKSRRELAASVVAVNDAGRRAVVPRRDNPLVFHYDGAEALARASSARSDFLSDFHEVLVPTRARENQSQTPSFSTQPSFFTQPKNSFFKRKKIPQKKLVSIEKKRFALFRGLYDF